MVQKFLNSIFLLLMIVSCKTHQNNITIEKINSYPQLNYSEISWGDCMRYEKPYNENDSTIVLNGLGMNKETYKYRSIFLAKMYVKENCEYQVAYQEKVLDGIYRINGINPSIEGQKIIGHYRPEYFIAKFAKGVRIGQWYYFPIEGFDGAENPNIMKALTGNENYQSFIQPIKVETYKNGFPDGEWWQKSENKVEYFMYKNGVLINSKMEFIKK